MIDCGLRKSNDEKYLSFQFIYFVGFTKVHNYSLKSILKFNKLGQCMDNPNAAAKVAAAKMPIDCYYLAPSPPCRSVLLLAKLVGVELNLKPCDITKGEHMTEEFIKMNPTHTIPTINDNGFILWESRPIMAYLVNQYGKDDLLYPKDPRNRAVVDQRLYFDMDVLFKRMTGYYYPTMFRGVPLEEENLQKLHEGLELFNTLLDGKKFSAGENLTIADVSLVVTISNIDAFGLSFDQYPNIKRWFEAVKEYLGPYGYEEINHEGAKMMAGLLNNQLAK